MADLLPHYLRSLGLGANDRACDALRAYAGWLINEAIPAGGIGPDEADRIMDRHVLDALTFAGVWDRASNRPVLDVGTGVGLPGIPLAIACPDRSFRLVDRSARRVGLARRAVRVLGIENVAIERADLERERVEGQTVVSRATLPRRDLTAILLANGPPAEIVLAGSRLGPVAEPGYLTVEIRHEILAQPAWLLRMAPT